VKAHVTFKREAVFSLGGEKPKSLHFKGIFVARSAPSSPSFTPPREREREREKLRDFVDVFFVRSVHSSAAGTQNRRCLFETFLLLNGDVNTNTDIILIIIVFEGVVHVEKKTAKNNREKNEQRDDVGAHDERYGC
jgi:hypothetical protein